MRRWGFEDGINISSLRTESPKWIAGLLLTFRSAESAGSRTLDTGFCAEALGEALNQGTPDVFNTEQGSQFTSCEFTQILQNHSVKISMDGRGRYQDNILVERILEDGEVRGGLPEGLCQRP